MKCTLAHVCTLLFIVCSTISLHRNSKIHQTETLIEVGFISLSGADLKSLVGGGYGEGLLVYSACASPSLFKIAVKLTKQPGSKSSKAEIIQIPDNVFSTNEPDWVNRILDLPPAVVIESLDGWWIKDSLPSYNLDIQVWGPIYAMWGAGADPKSSTHSWLSEPDPEQLTVRIMVRDENHDGIPDWELRSMVPTFYGRADIRSNYAERKCDSTATLDPGVFPTWPYISNAGGFEQPSGGLRPPVVVDFNSGLITHFSELVSVRGQNCTYSFYTIDALESHELNSTNFEAPFAFYDLSGEGVGYPNLILRTEHYPAGDRWFNHPTRDFETVRYSWRNAVGDGRWDYKVEVAGFHPYLGQTPIAGGLIEVDAPSYEDFPHWVLGRAWPAVTFIDTHGSTAHSSEGIYAWSPRELGDDYLRGEVDQPNPEAFAILQEGWQGEYRFTKNLPPRLYASPIDNRLHLLGAEAGFSNLGNDYLLREGNLDHDLYIDSWILEENTGDMHEEPSTSSVGGIKEAIYAVDGYLIYSGGGTTEILPTDFQPVMFEIDPPADPRSWASFIEQVEPITEKTKNPRSLSSWLADFPGKPMSISGASISDVEVSRNGFQFILELQPEYSASPENEILPIAGMLAGKYMVRYEGKFNLKPYSAVKISLEFNIPSTNNKEWNPGYVEVVINNDGIAAIHESLLTVSMQDGDQMLEIARQIIDLPGGEQQRIPISWEPSYDESFLLHARLEEENGKLIVSQQENFEIPHSEIFNSAALSIIAGIPGSFTTVSVMIFIVLLIILTVTRITFDI